MSKKIIALIIVLFVLGLMAITNPTKPEYVAWAEQEVASETQSAFAQGVVNLIGGPVIDSGTTVTNYVFFSIYKTDVMGKSSVMGTETTTLGLFHNFIPLQKVFSNFGPSNSSSN